MSPTRTTASCRCDETTARSSSSRAISLSWSMAIGGIRGRGKRGDCGLRHRSALGPSMLAARDETVNVAEALGPSSISRSIWAPHWPELLLDALEAAVEMIDAADHGFALRRQARR